MTLGLAAWLAVEASADAEAAVLAVGLTGAAVTGASMIWPVLLGLALAVSGSAYALLLAIDEPALDVRAAGVAAALVVVGELTGWARELAAATRDEPGGAWRRPTWIAAAGIGALLLVFVLLAIVDLARVEGLAVEAIGAVCALAAMLVAWRLARGPHSGRA